MISFRRLPTCPLFHQNTRSTVDRWSWKFREPLWVPYEWDGTIQIPESSIGGCNCELIMRCFKVLRCYPQRICCHFARSVPGPFEWHRFRSSIYCRDWNRVGLLNPSSISNTLKGTSAIICRPNQLRNGFVPISMANPHLCLWPFHVTFDDTRRSFAISRGVKNVSSESVILVFNGTPFAILNLAL